MNVNHLFFLMSSSGLLKHAVMQVIDINTSNVIHRVLTGSNEAYNVTRTMTRVCSTHLNSNMGIGDIAGKVKSNLTHKSTQAHNNKATTE